MEPNYGSCGSKTLIQIVDLLGPKKWIPWIKILILCNQDVDLIEKISNSLNNNIDQVDTKCGSYGFQMWVPWIPNVDPADAKYGFGGYKILVP